MQHQYLIVSDPLILWFFYGFHIKKVAMDDLKSTNHFDVRFQVLSISIYHIITPKIAI